MQGLRRLSVLLLVGLLAALPARPSDIQAILDKGIAAFQARDFETARASFGAILSQDPQRSDVHFYLAATLLELNRPDDAISEFEQASAGSAENPDFEYYYAIALDRTGRPREAVDHLERALWLKSDFLSARYRLSELCLRLDDLDGAIYLLRQVTSARPELAEGFYNLGLALSRHGHREHEAIQSLQAALKLQPQNPAARLALGKILAETGNVTQAVRQLRDLAALSPNDPEFRYNLGVALKENGDLAEARGEFEFVIQKSPQHWLAHKALAMILRQEGDYDAARMEFEASIAQHPEDAETRHLLGGILIRLGDNLGAVEHLRQAVRLDPLLVEGYTSLARALRLSGQLESAAEQRRKGGQARQLKANASQSIVLLQKAKQHIDARNLAAAIGVLRQIVAQSPEFVEARFELGLALGQNPERTSEAMDVFRSVVHLNPNHALAHYHLALLAEHLGDEVSAALAFKDAIRIAPSLIEARRGLASLANRTGDQQTAISHFRAILAWNPGDEQAKQALRRLSDSSEIEKRD